MIHVSIVEDEHTFRNSLEELINNTRGFKCSGAYPSAEEALKQIHHQKTDIVLMDIHLPGMNGIECTRLLKERDKNMQIMMLTVFENDANIFNSLTAGATGYILKRSKVDELLAAVKELHKGGSPMSGEIARKVVTVFQKFSVTTTEDENLTKREEEVLTYLAQGYRYKEIAEKMFVSLDAIKKHCYNIYQKLHVRSRSEAVNKTMKR